MDPYLIGTEKGFNLNITIINRREDAFETVFELEMPPDVQYSYTEGIKVIMNMPHRQSTYPHN